jgi:CARDB
MRKLTTLFLTCVVLTSLAIAAMGIEPFALEDLHLIHWEDVPNGRPSYTGPVSAAILMAWYAEHGYPELLPDLNHDGQVNEEDTLLLARDFGEEMGGQMIADQLADPFIVYPLARYVGERYPNEFRMLIYDESFPEEVEHDLGQPFIPTEVGGIVLEVHEDPFYELYIHHLEAQRPGIVGIGPDFPGWNHFSVSRSFIPQEDPEGFPVDLVSTSRRVFTEEPVWNTFLRIEFERWGFLTPEWVPFEILIVLIPAHEADGVPGQPSDGPGDDPGGDPGGGDQPRYPGQPGGEPGDDPGGDPRFPPNSDDSGVCCLPDGSCDSTISADVCERLGGTFTIGGTCATVECPQSDGDPCAAVEGEITDICYAYENDVLSVYVSYAVHNRGTVMANDITIYGLVGLNDGVNGLGGGQECQDWQYGVDIAAGSTYSFDRTYSTSAPNLDLNNLTYLYGSLWLQVEAPWDCWPIINQQFVQTWDPAPLCNPQSEGIPPGGSTDGGAGTPPGGSDGEPLGACCLPTGQCIETGITDCDTQGGEFRGEGSSCEGSDCPSGSSEGDCPSISAFVDEACYEYTGPNQPLIVRATFGVQNFGTATAQSPWMELTATCDITVNGTTTTYEDTTSFYGADIPPNGEITGAHEFNLGAVPQTPDSYVLVHLLSRITSPCQDYTETTGTNSSDIACSGSASVDDQGEPAEPDDPAEPDPDPETGALPNLWVTDVRGCWTWSNDGRENIVATVTGVIHNGGQADASNVYARINVGSDRNFVSAGFIPAGGQKTVSGTITVGPYGGSGSFPIPISIEADPLNAITEADESNNTTSSSFPESCN